MSAREFQAAMAAHAATRPFEARGAAALRLWAAEWQRLEAAPPQNPFLGFAWQSSWMDANPGAQPRLFAESYPDGRLAGLLACQSVRRGGIRCLEPLAQGSGGDEFDCLADAGADPGLAGRLLRAALAAPDWDWLEMESVRSDGPLARAFGDMRNRLREPGDWLPYLPLPASFETLLQAHSGNFREQLRRRRRRFAAAFPAFWVQRLEDAATMDAALATLFRLHHLRRREKHDSGIFADPCLAQFHRLAASRLAARGQARLYLLRTPEVAAALYGFSAGERFFFFQSGLDPAFAAANAGTVLLSAVVEDCIACGLRQFEFLRGDEEYKSRWTPLRRRALRLYAWRGPRGHAYARWRIARWRAGGWKERLLRPWRSAGIPNPREQG